jgi:hypothetical protein
MQGGVMSCIPDTVVELFCKKFVDFEHGGDECGYDLGGYFHEVELAHGLDAFWVVGGVQSE